MQKKVFISYRRDDSKYQARIIYDAFCRVLARGYVFMDIDSIPLGADFVAILKGWVDACDILLALIGPDWVTASDPRTGLRRLDDPNDFVRIETREALLKGIPVVPVLLDQTPMPKPDELPGDLHALVQRQAALVEFRSFDADVGRLIYRLGLGVQVGDQLAPYSTTAVQKSKHDQVGDFAKAFEAKHGRLPIFTEVVEIGGFSKATASRGSGAIVSQIDRGD